MSARWCVKYPVDPLNLVFVQVGSQTIMVGGQFIPPTAPTNPLLGGGQDGAQVFTRS